MTIEEYNKCVDEYSDRAYRFILANIKDKDVAKDILQDCFEKMWLKHENINFEKAKSYLFTSAYHTLIDYIRKNKRIIKLEQHDTLQNSYQQTFHYQNMKEVIENALNTLSNIQKSVLLLRDYEGYEYKEIAELTGLSESQVKVNIFRARLKMREYIGKIENII